MKQIAVVTGASSGLGREFVKLLCREPDLDEIWLIARSKGKLEAMVSRSGGRLKSVPLDLSEQKSIDAFAEMLNAQNVLVRFLVNSAGYGKFGSYSDLSVEQTRNMIDLNISGTVGMCLACIPHMKKGGRILNIASLASMTPLPYLNVYAATKAFVRNYSRALNVELREQGIRVTAVCPGWMDTGFIANAQTGAEHSPKVFAAITKPDGVAVKALRDAKNGRELSVYGFFPKLTYLGAKLLPQKFIMQSWLQMQAGSHRR
jgi:hypothetical protein